MKNLVGKKVYITYKSSMYFGEWGRIIRQDDDGLYYIAIADGKGSLPVFDRSQFKIAKEVKQ